MLLLKLCIFQDGLLFNFHFFQIMVMDIWEGKTKKIKLIWKIKGNNWNTDDALEY